MFRFTKMFILIHAFMSNTRLFAKNLTVAQLKFHKTVYFDTCIYAKTFDSRPAQHGGKRCRQPGRQQQDIAALRNRPSRLSQARLRINESLDRGDVSQKVLDTARSLTEVLRCQTGQVAQLPRYLPAQLFLAEEHSGDATVVSGDTEPLADRRVSQPLIVANPIRAAGGVIEGDQRFPFRFARGLRQRGVAVDVGVGATVATGVGNGSARSVVGAAVDGTEDGSSVGSSEPLQASSSIGRISARVKNPKKWRGVLISTHSPRILSRDGTARHVPMLARSGKLPASPQTQASGRERNT